MVSASKEHLEKHYADLSSKPFFPGLVSCTPSPRPIPKPLF
jgi:nucleoside diphosphate kinase